MKRSSGEVMGTVALNLLALLGSAVVCGFEGFCTLRSTLQKKLKSTATPHTPENL